MPGDTKEIDLPSPGDSQPVFSKDCQTVNPIPIDEVGLRRVPDRIPWVVLLVLIVELGERFTYFGLSGPLQNYIKNPYDPSAELPGALGKGQSIATALGNFFKFWAYASTVIGAIVADQYIGKFKTILVACGVYIVGLVVLVATATPASIKGGAAFGGLVTSMVIIGLGTGGIKANVTPFCAEQYQKVHAYVKTLKSGERVVVDPNLTVERMFMWFYWAVNIGALSPLITVNVEAKASFWLAFLIPLIVIVIVGVLFVGSSKLFLKIRPQGSPIVDAARTVRIALAEKSFENAKPSHLREHGKLDRYPFANRAEYTDYTVEKVKTGITACKVIWNNLISQAGQMALHGTPNDLLQNLDPIALIIFIPLLDSPAYVLVGFSEAFVIITGLEIAYTKAPESAGIIGLNVALELSKRGYGRHITVIAKHLPGDVHVDYTSPWAGANFSGISGNDPNALRWDKAGYLSLMQLIDSGAEEAKYLSKTQSIEYWDEQPSPEKIQSVTEYLRDVETIPKAELPPNVAFGLRFTTITLNAPAHCMHLKSLLSQDRYGSIKFVRHTVQSLQDAFISPDTKIVFNCIGNAAITLPGVQDPKCYPTRGQIVLVQAPSVKQNVMRHGKDYETYIIPRPDSDSTVILGGYLQKGDSDSNVREHERQSILQRTGDLLPVLKNGETKILNVAVGFRPSRQDGARVEREEIHAGKTVVHNYGAGGTGYQAGMGMAQDAVNLVKDILDSLPLRSTL
ncbi:hypothetical protein ATERTT37_000269 [Aspergillus terreus]